MAPIVQNKLKNVKTYNLLVQLVLLGGLFLMPFIFWPWAEVAYEVPRVWFICRWIEILLILGLFSQFFQKTTTQPNKKLISSVIIFFIVMISASVLGIDWQKSLWGNYYREDGLLTYLHLVSLFIFLSLYWKNSWKKAVLYVICLGSFLSSLWSTYLGFRLFVLKDATTHNWQGTIGGFFNQPNFLAGYLLVTLPFLIYFYEKSLLKKDKILWLGAISLQIIAIILTYSWAGVMGIFIILIINNLLFSQNKLKKYLSLIILVVILTGIIFTYFSYREKSFVAESRSRIYTKVFLGALKRPFLGWGWANVDYAFQEVAWPIEFDHDIYVDKAHSMILEVFATTGIVGLIIYLLMIFYLLKTIWSRIKKDSNDWLWWKTLLMVVIIYLFHSQTNVISIAEETLFWITLGITASYSNFS